MADRRRSPRYVLSDPLAAEAMPLHDATVERLSGDRLVVVSPSPQAIASPLVVHVATASGLQTRRATVVSSNPVCVAGSVHFRVELRLDEASPGQQDQNR